ncbi:hypothetical protein Btru_012343 [Bulinus truncatus]|nr:hypothetical protein Btru_012343 [Bulinus truncatus]
MRKQREVEVVATQVNFLEEEKQQLESRLLVIVSVIDHHKTWMTDEASNQFTFIDLLTQFSQLAESNDTIQKMLARLGVIEETILNLNLSNQRNENQISEMNKLCGDYFYSYDQKFEQQVNKIESFLNKHTGEFNIVLNEVRDQRVNVGAISKSVEGNQRENQQKFDELFKNVSSSRALKLQFEANAQNTSGKIRKLSFRLSQLEREMTSMKPTVQSLKSSDDFMKKSTDREQNDLNIKIKNLETRVSFFSQLVVESSKCIESNRWNVPGILVKSPLCTVAMEMIYKRKSPTEKSELDVTNKNRILRFSKQNILNSQKIDFCPETGIFKVVIPGVYLIFCKVFYFGKETKEVFLSSIIRENDTILTFSGIDAVIASNRGGRLFQTCPLERGDEICLQADGEEHGNISVGSFACIRLF